MTGPAAVPTLSDLADELVAAQDSCVPVSPVRSRGRNLSLDDAYAIQRMISDRRLDEGRVIVGHKIGLTSESMQRQLGVNEPDFGVLLDTMVLTDGAAVDTAGLIAPRIEAEIAVTLSREIRGPGVTTSDIAAAIASVVPALEIIDSRIANWDIALVDTVADNASSALAVAGVPFTGVAPDQLVNESVELLVDGVPVAQGSGSALLGDPLVAIAWLANRLGEYGRAISGGLLVLAGSVHASVPLERGRTYTARYSTCGSVTMRTLA